MQTGALKLYNPADDIGEEHGLATIYPQKVKELATELGDMQREWNAPMPRISRTGKAVPMPDEVLR